MRSFFPAALGWHRDLPDPRDYTLDHPQVRLLLKPLRRNPKAHRAMPHAMDLSEYCPRVDDCGELPSCTAQACAALVDYFERRAHGRGVDGSCQFLYRMSRLLLGWRGDNGSTLRATLKALIRFGLPPRSLDPHLPQGLDAEPKAFLFSFAREYASLVYARLDPPHVTPEAKLANVKTFLAAGLPVAFGFTVFDSLLPQPEVPFPSCYDAPRGGQAALAIGYDDKLRIRSEKGALRIRGCWGPTWGDGGCGWLPYRYVLDSLSGDFWVLLRPDWIELGDFAKWL